jgi:hypothetical protein
MSNKRLGAILLSIPFLTLAAACGPSSEASSNTAIVSPSSEVTSAVTTSVEMVPAQTGLAEHVEYEFTHCHSNDLFFQIILGHLGICR